MLGREQEFNSLPNLARFDLGIIRFQNLNNSLLQYLQSLVSKSSDIQMKVQYNTISQRIHFFFSLRPRSQFLFDDFPFVD